MHSVDNEENLTLGYKKGVNLLEDFCKEAGVDYASTEAKIKFSFREYIAFIRESRGMNEQGHVPSEEDLELLSISEEDFYDQRKYIIEEFEKYKEIVKEPIIPESKPYKPPYKKILNGVFPKVNKSTLSPAQKAALKVDGLLDECYDIFVDTETGKWTTVFYDLDTVNEHFFAFSVYLEKLKEKAGIENLNPYVPLMLFDRDLMHINTDQVTQKEIAVKIRNECRINPFYYFRECARTYDRSTGTYVRYEMTIASYTFIWLYSQCINTYREQSRQTGKTYDMTQAGGYEFALGSRKTMAMVVHFKAAEAGKNRRNMIDMVNHIPSYLKFHCIKKTKVKGVETFVNGPDVTASDLTKTVENVFFKNVLKTAAVGATETSAQQVGRGDTLQFVFIDELNYIKKSSTVLTAVQFAHAMARVLAEKAGDRYGMHFASTAGERNTDYGKEMYDLVHNQMCKFDPILFGYSHEDLVTYLEKNSKKNFFVISYNYQELGFGEKWLEAAINLASTREKFQQDVLNVWLAVNKDSVFSIEQMTRIAQRSQNNIELTHIYDKYYKVTYFPDKEDDKFVDFIKRHKNIGIGVDIALGTGNDYSVLMAIDLETAKPLFTYRNNTLNGYDFGILLRNFLRYIKKISDPDSMIIVNIEQDGPGQIVIPMLAKEKDIEPMLFRSLEYYNKQFTNGTVKATTRHINPDCYISYGTSMRKWRDHLYEVLMFLLVDKYPYAFDYSESFNELTTLKRSGKGGRIDHATGFHDDTVIATLHAYSMLFVNEFRNQNEKNFKFIVDFTKIEALPLSSQIVTFADYKKNHDIEGKVDISFIDKYDHTTRTTYQDVIITKIENGRKVTLSSDEVLKYINEHPELSDDPRFLNMKLKNYNLSRQLVQENGASIMINEIDHLSKISKFTPEKVASHNGMTLSNYNKRSSNYFKETANKYGASLLK